MRFRIKINLVCACLLCHESRTQIFFEFINETLGGTVNNTAQFSILLAWKKTLRQESLKNCMTFNECQTTVGIRLSTLQLLETSSYWKHPVTGLLLVR